MAARHGIHGQISRGAVPCVHIVGHMDFVVACLAELHIGQRQDATGGSRDWQRSRAVVNRPLIRQCRPRGHDLHGDIIPNVGRLAGWLSDYCWRNPAFAARGGIVDLFDFGCLKNSVVDRNFVNLPDKISAGHRVIARHFIVYRAGADIEVTAGERWFHIIPRARHDVFTIQIKCSRESRLRRIIPVNRINQGDMLEGACSQWFARDRIVSQFNVADVGAQ